jgi:glycerophosphoryl diester phosphodiesterase
MVKVALHLLMIAALSAQQSFFSSSTTWKPQIICAHRGALHASELENSVTVISQTVEAGIPMVEIDLAESKDKTIYLLHDRTLDRTTNASGPIREYTDVQLSKVYLLDPFTRRPVQPIDHFDDLLRWDIKSHAKILVDIKDTPPSDAVKPIRKYGVLQNVVLLTFDRPTAALAYAADPTVTVSVLVRSVSEIDRALQDSKGRPTALYVSQDSSPEVFAHAQSTGRLVITDALGSLDKEADAEQRENGTDQSRHQTNDVYERYLRSHPVNVFVTSHSLLLMRQANSK